MTVMVGGVLIVMIIVTVTLGIVSHHLLSQVKAHRSNLETSTSSIDKVKSSKSQTTQSNTMGHVDAVKAVKLLTVEQRAALIILGAPDGWYLNGYPSQTTIGTSIRNMALSDTNEITLSYVNTALAENTRSSDQVLSVLGNDIQGVGGVPAQTYAFGRDGDAIYYYVVDNHLDSDAPQSIAEPIGQKKAISKIWQDYYDVGDLGTVNQIAAHIKLK
ncbi:hypothetical protein H9L19_07815 [Weissella diestrammenae]|uniref:Uncharacterized protein n=2 Tax=Weissella diestrammenae TaxID=1162633 RepID=A0A7G9T583_9LACO|nr:hypothetical protein [Weissella diestrammenae]QNN75258.1 hypothetical protein H9L19_07815 [Weissella diestrammenae]